MRGMPLLELLHVEMSSSYQDGRNAFSGVAACGDEFFISRWEECL